MRKLVLLVSSFVVLVVAPAAQGAIPSVFTGDTVSGGGIACVDREGVRFCEGTSPGNSPSATPDTRVPTFDDVPLDVNVALPAAPASGPDGNYPLLMMFHGYGGSKLPFSQLKRYAERGYAVFTMSDRGFGNSCGSEGSRLAQPTACATGWVKLLDTRYEVRDAQELAGMLADEGVVDPQRIGATGGSYGGGLSMALAALRDRVMNPDGTLAPWTSPDKKPMRIAAAAPEIPWTDLAYSLAPNGGTLDYVADSPYRGKFGVPKQSFIAGLYASGEATGYYAPPGLDTDADLTPWFSRINAGEPYDGDPVVTDIVEELTTHHSSYYIDHSQPPAPLFISNGFTDDLFPVDEAIRFYNRTNSEHPQAHVSLFFLDYGHQRGNQPEAADVAQLRAAQDAFLDHYLLAAGPEPAESVTAITQACGAPSAGPFTAATWDSLSPGEVRFADSGSKTIAPSSGSQSTGTAFDPIAGGGACAKTSGADQEGTATYRLPKADGGGFTLMGSPTVIADVSSEGPNSQIAARLLDVAPDGQQTLVARGLYRPGVGAIAGGKREVFQLHGNGWRFEEGHVPKLELLPNDAPYGRASNGQAPVTISNLQLRLPTLEAPSAGFGDGGSADGESGVQAPLPAVLPDGSAPAPGIVAARHCQTGLEEAGTRRADDLVGSMGGDRLRGAAGADRIAGKAGDDCINGGKGKDTLLGGKSGDRIRTRDGERDRVSCGAGDDVVVADRVDRLRGCEKITTRR